MQGPGAPIEHFSNFFYSICGAIPQMNQEVGNFLVLLNVPQCSICCILVVCKQRRAGSANGRAFALLIHATLEGNMCGSFH